jgi:VanZ family protein
MFIFYLSSIPLAFPEIVNRIDPTKFSFHVVEYSILGFLLFNASKNFNLSFLIGSFYGLSDEIHQIFVPLRMFSVLDWVSDVIGVILGIILFSYLKKKNKILLNY